MTRPVAALLSLLAFSGLSLAVKENYPLSHFPMYADPADDVYYHWLADEEGQALPILTLTRKTAPKLGKMLRSYTSDRAKKLHVSREKLPEKDLHEVCSELLAYLRTEAQAVKQQLPEKLSIMRTDIHYVNGKLEETTRTVFAE